MQEMGEKVENGKGTSQPREKLLIQKPHRRNREEKGPSIQSEVRPVCILRSTPISNECDSTRARLSGKGERVCHHAGGECLEDDSSPSV